jgi:polyhydroxyalkanoate synthesis regulator phasin
MADEMTTETRVYPDPLTAQLGERVTNLGRRQSDLEAEMRSGFKQMESGLTSLGNEMRAAVAGLASNIAERNRVQWPAIGVMVSFCAIVGGVVAYPVNSSIARLDSTLSVLSDKMVTRGEIDWRTARAAEDRQRLETTLAGIRADLVPRAELSQRFDDLKDRIDRLEKAKTP